MPRFSPAFCRTLRPGFPGAFRGPGHVLDLQVLDPDQIEPPRDIRGHLSAQSLRRSASRACSRAIACLTRPRRFDPRLARASLRCSRRSRVRSARSGRGQCSSWPVDRAAETATPRSMPTTWPLPGRAPARGSRRRRHASGPRGPWSPGRTSRPAVPRGTSGTGPTRPWAPRPRRRGGTRGARPLPPAATIRNPSCRQALRHDGRPAGLAGSKNAAMAWVKSRRACCWTV